MIIFFGLMQKTYFFQLPKLNKYYLGVELDPVHQAIKMLKMDHLWVYTLYPTSCHNVTTATECDKKQKTKRACHSLEF